MPLWNSPGGAVLGRVGGGRVTSGDLWRWRFGGVSEIKIRS